MDRANGNGSSLRLYDNTRIKDYRRCPRYFYFRHYRGWRADSDPALPLVVGGAWGKAMDVVWSKIAEGERDIKAIVTSASEAWVAHWLEAGMPQLMTLEQEEEWSPRTPGNFLEMIWEYVDARMKMISSMELVACEKAFVVPLDPRDDTLFYVGRMDKLVKYRKKHLVIEHKTTTAYKKDPRVPFRPGFLESFSPESQVDGYIFALHMMVPGSVGGCWVDAALVHKQVHDGFHFIPIERSLGHLDAWLWETRHWISHIEANIEAAETTWAKESKILEAFPKDTGACFDFNRSCDYLDLCKARPDPQRWSEPPPGYKEERWDPLDHIPNLKETLERKSP